MTSRYGARRSSPGSSSVTRTSTCSHSRPTATARAPSLDAVDGEHDLARRRRRCSASPRPPRGSSPERPTRRRRRRRRRRRSRTASCAAARQASGPTRLPVRGSSRPPVSSGVTPGWPCRAAKVSGPLVRTVRSRAPSSAPRQPHDGRRGVEGDGAGRGHELGELGRDAALARAARSPRARRTAAARPPWRRPRTRRAVPALLELGEVTADRHLADAERLGGRGIDGDRAVGVQLLAEPARAGPRRASVPLTMRGHAGSASG